MSPMNSDEFSRLLVLVAFLLVTAVGIAFCGCSPTRPSVVNPDPVRGGPCENGDQGCKVCAAHGQTWSCPDMYLCATDTHGCELDDSQWGPGMVAGKTPDAGADR